MTQFTLTSAQDGLALHGLLVVPPSGQVRGVVQISHGMAEHKQRYLPFMRYLAKHGFACAIHDHRGHGQSVRDSAHWGYFYAHGATAEVEDLKQVTEYLQEKFPEAPFYLFGHSMGSLIARVYCKT